MKKYKLIYIAGTGRSGSTLLSTLLSETINCVCIGEPIWSNIENTGLCACGKKFSDCKLWGRILREYFQITELNELPIIGQDGIWGRYKLLLMLLGVKGLISNDYLDYLKKLYAAIYEVSGTTVIIDESKIPPYLYALTKIEMFDIYVVHLLRDPRAVAFSWQRVKQRGTTGYMPRNSWSRTALRWLKQNCFYFISHGFVPKENYIKIRYEDFVEEPETQLKKIITRIGLIGQTPFISKYQFKIAHENHLISSNPSVPKQGLNTIRKDVEWKEKMPFWAKAAVTLICWPMILVYRYPIFSNTISNREKRDKAAEAK